jgi:hypothetical protein
MNPFNIRQPQDRRKVYNEYLAGLQMQIDNLAKTEKAVATLERTGAPPVQPMDTRTLSEKLLDVDKQKKVLRQALLEITDGAEATKIMNTISDEDVVFLGVAFGDFSKMIKQKFSSGILAPLFNEVLQRYKRDYINSLSVQRGISSGHTTEELLLSIRELLRLAPTSAQLRDLVFTIGNVPEGVVPPRMRQAALQAAGDLSALIPSASMVQAIDNLNPVDRAATERALNDGLSSITTGAVLQDLTGRLQRASAAQAPDILTSIINEIILTRDDKAQLEQAKAIAEAKTAIYEAEEPEFKSADIKKKSALLSEIKIGKEKKGALLSEIRRGQPAVQPVVQGQPALQLASDIAFVENSELEDIVIMTVPRLKAVLIQYSNNGVLPIRPAEINKLPKPGLLGLIEALKVGQFQPAAVAQLVVPSPVKSATKKPRKKPAAAASQSIFVLVEYDPTMDTQTFEARDYADKRSIIEDALGKGVVEQYFNKLAEERLKAILNRNDPKEEGELVAFYRALREQRGFSGEGLKKKGKRIAFGCGLAKPRMMVKPDNIDIENGIKKEVSYIPIGKYVVNKHKLRDNMLLMRTVKGGQIAELPQMSISPKLGKMLNNIISGRGFPSHDELSSLEDSDKDIMYKVFKMSKAEGIDAIPRPNKTKDEAEFNRFTILKGQILAGNNSKEMIKEFKTLLVKLIHGGKILRREGHDLLIDLAALGY